MYSGETPCMLLSPLVAHARPNPVMTFPLTACIAVPSVGAVSIGCHSIGFSKWVVSKLVNSLKGASSRKMKRYHPELSKPAYLKDALWSPSYFAGSVGGAPLSLLKQYIEQQTRPN